MMEAGTHIFGAVVVLLIALVRLGQSGECCRAHYDILQNEVSNDQQWCDNYCCWTLVTYDCCDNILMRAPEEWRADFCWAWFNAHIYVPILIFIGIVGSIILCCVCCCVACCRNSSGTVIMPPQPQRIVVLASPVAASGPVPADQSSSPGNPFNVGYDQ